MWLNYDDRYRVSEDGNVMNRKTGLILKPQLSSNGYLHVNLRGKFMRIHRLVALCFLPYTDIDGLDIDHINRDRTDNRVINLRWVTRSQNMRNTDASNIYNHHSGQYRVIFSKYGKNIYYKMFKTMELAVAARDAFKLTDAYKL